MNIHFCLTKFLLHAHFLAKLRGLRGQFGSFLRVTIMEDANMSYGYEEEFRRLGGSMGNVETKSNGRRGREEPV